MPLTIGNTLHHGQYLINHVLGQSDLGATFQGTQVQQNRPVVLKVLQPNPDLGIEVAPLKQRFFDQIQRFAQCQHPGLVRLIDSFESEDAAIAVFDYTAGQTLLEVVQTQGALAESQAVQSMQQVGSALAALHDKGLIHRSVTPQNIIRPIGSNIVVLVNVGLLDPTVLGIAATRIESPLEEYAAIEHYQTQSPQPQFPQTPATDIYALAGTLYFLLTGYAPLAAPLRQRSPLPSPRQLRPQLTPAVESAILQGLELNPNSRPQTIAEWLALLPPSVSSGDRDSNSVLDTASLPTAPPAVTMPQVDTVASAQPNPFSAKSASLPTHRFISQPHQSMTSSPLTLKNTFPKTVLATAAIAAAIGLGAGLTLRVAATSTGPGTSIFHTEQAFPPFENWPGAAPLMEPSTSYSSPVIEIPKKREEPSQGTQSKTAEIAPPPVQESARTKPVVADPAPVEVNPPVPAPNPTPRAIAPTPTLPTVPEPDPPPAMISPPPAAEVSPEPAAPPSAGTPSAGEVQRQ
jgi:serine/threonine-protein kinase